MLDIGGTTYIIDLLAMENILTMDKDFEDKKITETETKILYGEEGEVISKEVITKEYDKPKEYDSSKYEVIRILFEILLTYNDEFDDTLGLDLALSKATLPFKITFNTLVNYGILKEIED